MKLYSPEMLVIILGPAGAKQRMGLLSKLFGAKEMVPINIGLGDLAESARASGVMVIC